MDTKMIGSKIASARKKVNISQAGLAAQVFVSPQAVGKWERGESLPDVITLNQLAKILEVDLNYFSENFYFPESNKPIEEKVVSEQNIPGARQTQLLTNFSGAELAKTDFSGINAHGLIFNGSNLAGSDFTDADITGSTFKGSNAHEAVFLRANLTDCNLSATNLQNAEFSNAILINTRFYALDLAKAKFSNTKLSNVKFSKTDLRETIFQNCGFEGVDFDYSDLRGLCLDDQTFANVLFHNAALNETSFKGATLINCSFRSTFALTNKYYRAIKTIRFGGASMDKLTHASLKGLGADLAQVTLI